MINCEEVSVIAGSGQIKEYKDLLAKVRYDGKYHSVKALVQPDNPEVREIARVLVQAKDFIGAAQEFVDSFTTYESEVGDYWAMPGETLDARACDCDDKAILLCSILRNYLPADQVYCAFGLWLLNGETSGHMYVVTEGEDGQDRIIEATAGPGKKSRGKYVLHGIFNDKYTFSTDIGLKEFDLKSVELEKSALVLQGTKISSQKDTASRPKIPLEQCDEALEESNRLLESLEARLEQTPKPSEVWNGSFM